MPFKPGESGNPGGRPKLLPEVVTLARKHTIVSINTLLEIVTDKKAAKPARVSAAVALLERGWGKPTQPTEHSGEGGGPIVLAVDRPPPESRDEWLERRARELAADRRV